MRHQVRHKVRPGFVVRCAIGCVTRYVIVGVTRCIIGCVIWCVIEYVMMCVIGCEVRCVIGCFGR